MKFVLLSLFSAVADSYLGKNFLKKREHNVVTNFSDFMVRGGVDVCSYAILGRVL